MKNALTLAPMTDRVTIDLKKLRLLLGLTQEQFADALSTTKQAVSKWETNVNRVPSQKLRLICHTYDVLAITNGEGTKFTLPKDFDKL